MDSWPLVISFSAAAAAILALGGLQANAAAPGIIGGFAATGAVLLALAIAVGEGVAILPGRGKTSGDITREAGDESSEALAAIGASYQGMFEFDAVREIVKLSPEGAALLGLYNGAEMFSSAAWLARIHPDDRDTFRDAMERFRGQKGLAFRIEFRAQTENGAWCWLELRATALGRATSVERYLDLFDPFGRLTTMEETLPWTYCNWNRDDPYIISSADEHAPV